MQLNVKNIFVILLITSLLIILGCNEKNNTNQLTLLLPDTLKKACLFAKGSYWIYKNDSTGQTDSTFVSGDPITGYKERYYANTYLAEYKEIPLQSSIICYFYLMAEPYNDPPRIGRLFTRTHLYNPFVVCDAVAYPIYNDSTIDREEGYGCTVGSGHNSTMTGGGTYSELQRFYGYQINGIQFKYVLLTRFKYYHTIPFESDQDSLDFYFSPGNGFAKFIFRADTSHYDGIVKRVTISWSILRYHVIK